MHFVAVLAILAGNVFAGSSRDSLVVYSRDGSASVVGLWNCNKKTVKNPSGKAQGKPVAVWFHGGMTSGNCQKGLVAGDDLSKLLPHYTVVSVSACKDKHWVTPTAVEWVDIALDSVAALRGSSVDSVYLLGVSDGALGVMVYSLEGRRNVIARTLVSSFGPVLGEASQVGAALREKSGKWLFIQGGEDRLFPPSQSVPWIEGFCRSLGANCEIKYDPKGEHDWIYWKKSHKDWVLKLFL